MSKAQKPPTKKVKLEAFAIHGHLGNVPVDYEALFSAIADMDPVERKDQVGDRVTVLPVFRREDDRYYFAAHVGTADASFLLLDLRAGTEEERALEPGKIVTRKTLGLVDPRKRVAVVQFVQQGARAGQIAMLLEKLARRINPVEYAELSLEFTPVPAEEFLEALAEFDTIKSASMRFARPNYDWEDYGATFQTLGQESGASALEVQASARRNGSLNKDGGIIGLLRDVVRKGRSMLKTATVTGNTASAAGLVTLRLDKHIETKQAEVPSTSSGQPAEAEVHKLAKQFLEERPKIEE
ncbi:MAG: hypothetical protein J0H49_09445 [Acidobacteria bacterium]|nr:hypothetical protein [Acidobacteriota bacterium]